jgi:hypothetical protein
MRWVTALALEQWSQTIGSRITLSEIVSALVRASAQTITSFRFPTGDSAQLPGYDGRLTAVGLPPFVPDGESVWEFGTGASPATKADEDYKTKTAAPRDVACSDATFVFVTSRRWAEAEEWAAAKRRDGIWRDVRVVDAVALEAWLEGHPGVASRIARYILKVVSETGARSTDEFWEEYTASFKPPLTEAVLLCDREQQTTDLLTRLEAGPQDIQLQADSPEEVVAFAVAAIRAAETDRRKWLEARTLILDTDEAARQLAHLPNMIYIPRGAAWRVSGLLATYNPTIVPLGRDRPNVNVTVLTRPSTRALGNAIESMGFSPEDAYQTARTSGRSVTILRRRIPNGDAGKPEWADGSRALVAALLCGGWVATSDEDKEILRKVANVDRYDTYEATLLPLLRLHDPPLDREGEVWRMRAPVDAFVHLAYLVTSQDLSTLREVATEVFAEVDPSLDQPDEGLPTIRTRDHRLRHSEWLRDGLATTLLQIAVLGPDMGLVISGDTPQSFVDGIVKGLPGLSNDYRLIASLGNQLPLLAEAAPRPFLAALDSLLGGKIEDILPLFRAGGLFSRTSPHTYLLWALEPLAWDPEYLSQVSLILSKLAIIDPGGPTNNRPMNTLKEIFLSWSPNTNATLPQRLGVLDQIIDIYPNVAWTLLTNLLPGPSGVSFPNARPRFREAGASERERLTWATVFEAQREVVARALGLVGSEIARWKTVLASLSNFEPLQREEVFTLLQRMVDISTLDWKSEMWEVLFQEVNKHKSFPDAEWSLKRDDLARLDGITARLAPADTLQRNAWLFDSDYPDVPSGSIDTKIAALEEARRQAVLEIRSSVGETGLLTLADRVGFPGLLGAATVSATEDLAVLDALIDGALGRSDRLDTFAYALSAQAERRFQEDWHARVVARARTGRWQPQQIATLMLGFDDGAGTWNLVASLGGEVDQSYWSRKHAFWLKGDVATAERAARKYLDVGRAMAALDALHNRFDRINISLVYELLDAALDEINRSQRSPRGLFVHNLGEIFQKLRARSDVTQIDLARREYAYLPLLQFEHPSLALHELMAKEPSLYVDVLSDVFRQASGDAEEPTPERRAKAQAGYQLLRSFATIPGGAGDQIDIGALTTWVHEVRRLAAEADRAQIADQYIGHLLAHSPNDPTDHAWPHSVVRKVIESLRSDDVERGIMIERFNMRGVVSKAVFEGGEQERALADQARAWAKSAASQPRTTAMLRKIAENWEEYAKAEDVRAEQDKMKYE